MWSRAAGRLGALAAAAILGACGPAQPSFESIDVTGADFGRELQLTDHTGRTQTLADFKGKVTVVSFGFTRCPDVCPTTLAELKLVKEKLGKDGERLQVLFVTVDPERDSPELLAKYVPAFDPSFLGLYGDADATARTAKEFRVFYQKVPGSSPDNYSVDHTAASYVYDPQGRLRLFVKYGRGAEPLVHDVKRLLEGG
ncbi:MAG: SCO family protein [Burkholderiales bacterium]